MSNSSNSSNQTGVFSRSVGGCLDWLTFLTKHEAVAIPLESNNYKNIQCICQYKIICVDIYISTEFQLIIY